MTQCKMFFFSGNANVEKIIQALDAKAGMTGVYQGVDATHNEAFDFDIKKAGLDLNATEKTSVDNVAKDLGVLIVWI